MAHRGIDGVRSLALLAVLSTCACECPDGMITRTYPIDAAQAAQLLDAHGQPVPSACMQLCDALLNARFSDAGVDGSVPAGGFISLPPGATEGAFDCGVVSIDTMLAVTCEWHVVHACYG